MSAYPKRRNALSRNDPPHLEKVRHVNTLLEKHRDGQKVSDFLQLAFLLRTQAIVVSYFPNGSMFGEISRADYSAHPGRKTQVRKEKQILRNFDWALREIKRNPRSVALFNKADGDLWNYRAKKWEEEIQ